MQVDELYKICGVLGSPTLATWPEGLQLATSMGFTFPSFAPIPLHQLVAPPWKLCLNLFKPARHVLSSQRDASSSGTTSALGD